MIAYGSWGEVCRERLEEDTLGFLLTDEKFCSEFLCWMDEDQPKIMQSMLNRWLETKDGKRFFEDKLQELINEAPENDEERD